jgi:hypothetical protein
MPRRSSDSLMSRDEYGFCRSWTPARCGIVKLYNVPGVANPADAFTKHLGRKEFQEYMRVLYNCDAECLRAGRRSRL